MADRFPVRSEKSERKFAYRFHTHEIPTSHLLNDVKSRESGTSDLFDMSILPKPIEPYWKILEDDRISILASVARLDSAQLRLKPDPGSWCILEVIEHLKRIDGQILAVVQKSSNSRPITLKDQLYYFALLFAMEVPFKFRAPRSTAPKQIPDSLDLLTSEWSQIRKDWLQYLKQAPNAAMKNSVFTHPRAGNLTLPQSLKWMSRHQRRHHRQIKRLISSADSV